MTEILATIAVGISVAGLVWRMLECVETAGKSTPCAETLAGKSAVRGDLGGKSTPCAET